MPMNIRRHAWWIVISCTVSAAHAAAPAGVFACTPAPGYLQSESQVLPSTSGLLQGNRINLSYFDLGASQTGNANSGTGSGSGKLGSPLLRSIVLRAPQTTFVDFYSALSAGVAFPRCSVLANLSNGNSILFELSLATLQSVHAIVSEATSQSPRSASVEAILSFAAIEIRLGPTDPADAAANEAGEEN
jgi:hypothetical protein